MVYHAFGSQIVFGSLFVIGIIVVPLCAKTLTRPRELQNTDQNDKWQVYPEKWIVKYAVRYYWLHHVLLIIFEFIFPNNAFF